MLPHNDWDLQPNFEPAGSEPITIGNISKCASFWRTFVKSKWVMRWIDSGYELVWVTSPPIAKEMPNSKSALEHHDFVSKAIAIWWKRVPLHRKYEVCQWPFGKTCLQVRRAYRYR